MGDVIVRKVNLDGQEVHAWASHVLARVTPSRHRGLVFSVKQSAVPLGGLQPSLAALRTKQIDGMTTATESAYVNTGDCSAYSSVVLQCGVSYSEDAIARHDSLQAEHDRPAHQHRCGGR